jgi:hypothetical protein
MAHIRKRKRAGKTPASPFDEFFPQHERDPRPFWKRYDADKGLNLRDASIFYGDDHPAETVWTLEREGYQDLQNCDEDGWPTEAKALAKRNRLELNQRRLQVDLTWKLRRGELYATGFVASASADMPATRIHTSRWAHLVPDFETSSATGLGQTIYGLLVFDGRTKVKDPPSKHAYSAQRLRECIRAGWQPTLLPALHPAATRIGRLLGPSLAMACPATRCARSAVSWLHPSGRS